MPACSSVDTPQPVIFVGHFDPDVGLPVANVEVSDALDLPASSFLLPIDHQLDRPAGQGIQVELGLRRHCPGTKRRRLGRKIDASEWSGRS